MEVLRNGVERWNVTVVDTGENTMTGGRLKRVRSYMRDDTFCLTYGDGVSNVNIRDLIDFHRSQSALATLVAAQPPGRFGALTLEARRRGSSGSRRSRGRRRVDQWRVLCVGA